MHDRFGQRYISEKEFLDYAKHLGLFTDHPSPQILEFLEQLAALTPVARIRFPAEVIRRWHKDRHPNESVPDPIEGDTDRLKAANDLRNEIFSARWSKSEIFGEKQHPLDHLTPKNKSFVQTVFDLSTFRPWSEFRTTVAIRDGKEIADGGIYTRACFHYWQVFILATFLRSGLTILYDLEDEKLFRQLHELKLDASSRKKLYVTMNLEARHEIRKIIKHRKEFDAVAYFEAYSHNFLQKHIDDFDRVTGQLPGRLSRQYGRRQREIARESLRRFSIRKGQVLGFIKFQCELWDTAKKRGPARIADEYARNLEITIDLYRIVARCKFADIVEKVGYGDGRFKPILKIIFPDWIEEQRQLAGYSLKGWILPSMANLPHPFTVSEQDIEDYCDWLEKEGLFQLYWHFRRLMDLRADNGPIAQSAMATEAVSYANTVELMANAVLRSYGPSPRGQTLFPKIQSILRSGPHARLADLVQNFKKLTGTNKSTLRRRITQIDRLKQGGIYAQALRIILKLVVIRNEGSHLGFQSFNRKQLFALLEALAQSSLVLWKAR